MDEDAAEEEEGEEVRDGHEGVHAVGEVPDDGEVHDAADEEGGDVKDAVDDDPATTAQVLHGPFAIVAPAEDGGEGEGEQAEGEQGRADDGYLREGGLGERGAVVEGDVGVGQDAADDDEPGEGADDNGVPECAAAADQRLAHGVARLGGGSDNRCRAHARLIGEEAAGDAVAGGHHHRGAHETATGSLRREGRGDDELEGRPQEGGVGTEDIETAGDIEQGHERHEQAADAGDALDAAKDDGAGEQTDDGARQGRVYRVGLVGDGGYGVGLDGVADAEGGQSREDGEEDGRPAPAETALQGVHRSAEHTALRRFHTILDGQQTLGIFRRDAEDTRQPAPQYGTRTAEGDGRGHADDVARADGGGQGCG